MSSSARREIKEDKQDISDDPFIKFMTELAELARRHPHIRLDSEKIIRAPLMEKILDGTSDIPRLDMREVRKIIDSMGDEISRDTKDRIIAEAQTLLITHMKRAESDKEKRSARENLNTVFAQFFEAGNFDEKQLDQVLDPKSDIPLDQLVLIQDTDGRNILHFLARENFENISARGLSTLLGSLDTKTLEALFSTQDKRGKAPLLYDKGSIPDEKFVIITHYLKLAIPALFDSPSKSPTAKGGKR